MPGADENSTSQQPVSENPPSTETRELAVSHTLQAQQSEEQNSGAHVSILPGDRGRVVLMAYCLFFIGLLFGQYAWMLIDKPEPLPWKHGEKFQSFQVEINNATWVDWMQLPGIGQTMAERILQDLDRNGPFRSIDDLTRVHGIGPKTLDQIRPWLAISFQPVLAASDQ